MSAFREEPMMPPEDSVKSWAMVRYAGLFDTFLGYPLQAANIFMGFQPFMKVDNDIKKKSAELVAGAATPDEKLQQNF